MLISRPISWLMNSSFRPELSASSMVAKNWRQMGTQPDDLLADIGSVGQDRDLPDQVVGLDRHAVLLAPGPTPARRAACGDSGRRAGPRSAITLN